MADGWMAIASITLSGVSHASLSSHMLTPEVIEVPSTQRFHLFSQRSVCEGKQVKESLWRFIISFLPLAWAWLMLSYESCPRQGLEKGNDIDEALQTLLSFLVSGHLL